MTGEREQPRQLRRVRQFQAAEPQGAGEVIRAWGRLLQAVPPDERPIGYLAKLTGLPFASLDHLREARNLCAHPETHGYPTQAEVDRARRVGAKALARLAARTPPAPAGPPDDDERQPAQAAETTAETPPGMVPLAEWEAQQQAARAWYEEGQEDDGAVDPERASARTMARLCAAAWSIPPALAVLITAPMAASSAHSHFVQAHAYATEPPSPPPYTWWLLAIGGVCWLICTAAELIQATRLADAYPPLGPWARIPTAPALRAVRRAAGGIDRRLGTGGGLLGLAAIALAGPAVVLAWSTLTAAAAPLWILAVGAATLVHLTTAF